MFAPVRRVRQMNQNRAGEQREPLHVGCAPSCADAPTGGRTAGFQVARRQSRWHRTVGLVFAVAALGGSCTAESQNETVDSIPRASVWPTDAGTAARPTTDAGGRFAEAYFASVTGSGTGCPERSWNANIKASGETFELVFSAFDLAVGTGVTAAAKDCLLSIRLRGTRALSYAILDTYYTGHADLDEGVSASHTVTTYVQGNPRGAKERRAQIAGPIEDAYSFKGESKVADIVWSDCARDINLNIRIELQLVTDQRKGKGYAQLQKLSAFRLATRECGG